MNGSKTIIPDRINFFKAQMIFWILAASDGHAKNFSIFLEPQGSYRLAPLYDILSVHPWLGKTGDLIQVQRLKMAMAVRGQNAHYHWTSIQRKHWEASADRNGLKYEFDSIINELINRTTEVIRSVSANLPSDFPAFIADPIFHGMTRAVEKLSFG